MITTRSAAIWFCVFALLVVQITAAGKNKRKVAEERRIRALRPSFVKRETQAPLIHAGEERIDDEYIVKLRDGLTDEELAAFERRFQELAEQRGLHIDFQVDVTSLMKGFVARVPADAVEILRWLDEVEFVEEDEVIHGSVTWGLDRIDQADLPLDNIYSSSPLGDGSGVNVFVLDTGIRFSHNEFGGRAFSFFDAFSDGQNGNDCHGHGTHCAGTIGGSTVGVAPGVTLYAGRVLNCQGSGSTSGVVAGMDAVAASNMKPAVVSMSLGGGHSTTSNLAVKRLTDAGYIVVVAAGNENTDACTRSPASAPEAITVGATESDDDLAYYSNHGSCVNIQAPGSDVYSASYSGDGSYTTMSGTSMATPHVAGVAALMLQADSSLTQTTLLSQLLDAAPSDKVDMSRLTDSQRASTPNKLLNIPANNGELRLFTEAKTFEAAYSTCQANGMAIVHDTNADKHSTIVALLQSSGVGSSDIWLNGRQDSSNAWVTTEGNPLGSYQPWQSGEPNGSGRCLQLWAGAGHKWDDTPCDSPRYFVCQQASQLLCETSCSWYGDGECDDGGINSLYSVCAFGSDCADCGPRPIVVPDVCEYTCNWNADDECDDGGPNSQYSVCDYGTDCADCGPRPPL